MIAPEIAVAARAAPYLAANEERLLLTAAQAGCLKSRDVLVRSHLRLAIKAAGRFRGRDLDPEDAAQEAFLGLVKAIDAFDLAQDVRFGTYAAWHIKAALGDAALRAPAIRMGTSPKQKAMFFGLRRRRAELERRGLTHCRVLGELARSFDVEVADIEAAIIKVEGDVSSLNQRVGNGEDDAEIGTMIPDNGPLPDALAAEAINTEGRVTLVAQAMAALNEREAAIVRSRLLVEDEDERGLKDLAAQFGISKERVRQIEVAALKKMRAALCRSSAGRTLI